MKVVMDWLKKITDIIVPPIDSIEEEEVTTTKSAEEKVSQTQEAQAQAQVQHQQNQAQSLAETMNARRAVAGGGGYSYKNATTSRPNLTLIKPPEFVMKVYQPSDYNNINSIAKDILEHKVAVVNYEYVHAEEQRRICDYIDGVCYAVDGTVTKISEKIVLYVPAGISTSDIAALVASSVNYR